MVLALITDPGPNPDPNPDPTPNLNPAPKPSQGSSRSSMEIGALLVKTNPVLEAFKNQP